MQLSNQPRIAKLVSILGGKILGACPAVAQGVVLVLTKIATNKQEVSRMLVRLAGITMNKARQMCDSLPARLVVCSNRTNAIEAIELLRRSGAVVEIAK